MRRWLSQYSHEAEILFGPLTGIEVRGVRCDGAVVVIEVALSVNLNALTLEQVVSKRRKMLFDMASAMRLEVRDALADRAEWADPTDRARHGRMAEALVHDYLADPERTPVWLNDDVHFGQAMNDVLLLKKASVGANQKPDELHLKNCASLKAMTLALTVACEGLLHTLNLSGCSSLTAVPESLGGCVGLHTLDLSRCSSLTAAGLESLGGCVGLHTLDLSKCSSLTAVPKKPVWEEAFRKK